MGCEVSANHSVILWFWEVHIQKTRAGMPVLGFTCRGQKNKQRGNLGTCWMWVNLFSFTCSLNNIPLLLRNIVPWVCCHLWIKTDTFLHSDNLSGFLIFIYWKKSDTASGMKASPGVKQLIQCQFLNACYLQFQLQRSNLFLNDTEANSQTSKLT